MSPFEIAVLLALTAYAIYRQTQRHEVVGHSRSSSRSSTASSGSPSAASSDRTRPPRSLSSARASGSAWSSASRGHWSRVWAAADGRVYSQGTALTVALFLALVASRFALGTVAYLTHAGDEGGFGEIMLRIAVMVAFQAELIWRRALPLGARASSGASEAPAAPQPA